MKNFRQVLGQDRIVQQLKEDIRKKQCKHAYLFVGSPGIGKRTLAQAFAKSLLCLDPLPDADACGICHSCKIIAHNNHPDLYTMHPEPGKEYKIEEIREMQKELSYKSFSGSHRVVLIDEADKLGSIGGNSLLKIMEDPPFGTVFLLVANSVDSLLETMVSRCQVMRCMPLKRDIVMSLWEQEYGLDPIKAGLLADLSSDSMTGFHQEEQVEDTSAWLDYASVYRLFQEQPFALWDVSLDLEKQERLVDILLYWRKCLRDTLVQQIEPMLDSMGKKTCLSVSEETAMASMEIIQEAIVALSQRGNKRLAIDVMLQRLRMASKK